ncbi:unnamed protein product [Rotaria sp. Silwood1]|nr:unnamed protein product [Rotaria sp. Silwood1]CAF4047486.1 unnamed protein product [Rotaria sp. Silwood1]
MKPIAKIYHVLVTRYTYSDGLWTRLDGNDAIKCPNTLNDQCRQNNISLSHYCIDPYSGDMGCLPIKYAADTYVHCLGATNEQYHCQEEYPLDYDKRFKCWNSSICISPLQLCDCHVDCPFEDDENDLLCRWGKNQCHPATLTWACHRGIYVHTPNLKKNFSCFCPPSYYGNRCQYQTKRLSVVLQLETSAIFYRHLVSLIDPRNGTIISYEDILYTPEYQCTPKIYFNLLYSQLLSDKEQSKILRSN